MIGVVNIGILWAIAKLDQQTDELWEIKWHCNIGETWGHERRLAKMYNTAKEAVEAMGKICDSERKSETYRGTFYGVWIVDVLGSFHVWCPQRQKYRTDSGGWETERKYAKVFDSPNSAYVYLVEMHQSKAATVTQHIDGYGLTVPRVWVREMPV